MAILRRTDGWAMRLVRAMLAVMPFLAMPALAQDGAFEEGALESYKGDAVNGQYLFSAASCGTCHGAPGKPTLLSGGMRFETAIGKFYAPNISPGTGGIGGWTNAQFLNAVMNGMAKNGGDLYPIMPFNSYHGMKPEDVLDIKAYIETLEQSDAVNIDHELPLTASIPFFSSYRAEEWKSINLSRPFQQKQQTVIERGRYLAQNVAGCGNCHTPHDASLNLDPARDLTGWTGLTNATAPDISRTRIAGLPSADSFLVDLIKDGKKFSGSPIADPLMRGVSEGLRSLRPEDQEALYAYLSGQEIKKIDVAKSPTAVCKQHKPAVQAISSGAAKFAPAAEAFMNKYCRNCHGPGQSFESLYRTGDLASIAADPAFVVPGNADASRMFVSIKNGSMPKGSRPPEFADDLKGLEAWLNGLAADSAATVPLVDASADGRSLLPLAAFQDAAFKDIQSLPEHDRQYQRYFSFREAYNTWFGCEDHETFMKRLPVLAGGFRKLLNSLSHESELLIPRNVEGSGELLVRVDIRDLGWNAEDYKFLADRYPYGMDPSSTIRLKPIADAAGTSLPIMRADWFVSFAARPEFYNRLMRLPPKIKDMEDQFGINVVDNIRNLRIRRAAFEKGSSGVSDHNRMIERHDIRSGYYWKSYDFAGDKGKQVLANFPHGPEEAAPLAAGLTPFQHDGGEMIFSLPNGLQGYYLSTNKGDRIDVGPTSIVSHRSRPHGATFGVTITNARSCFDCHENGIVTKSDQMRKLVENSNAFDPGQKELLLAMYVEQRDLDALYAKDRERFVGALSKIGVTEKNSSGIEQSLRAPGDAEIVTYNADKYDDSLDIAAVAGEFDMKPEEFSQKVSTISDANLQHLTSGWINRLKVGKRLERQEIEESFASLLPHMLGVNPLAMDVAPAAKAEPKLDPTPPAADTFRLDATADKTNAKVGETLSFDVTANKACDLQVVYVEADGNVESIPEEMIGKERLKAGEVRTIPQPETGVIRFDTPGKNETLVILCRTEDLAGFNLDKEKAIELTKKYKSNFKRGVAIELAKKVRSDPEANAFKFITFNISQ